jgi:hypothetical protein
MKDGCACLPALVSCAVGWWKGLCETCWLLVTKEPEWELGIGLNVWYRTVKYRSLSVGALVVPMQNVIKVNGKISTIVGLRYAIVEQGTGI